MVRDGPRADEYPEEVARDGASTAHAPRRKVFRSLCLTVMAVLVACSSFNYLMIHRGAAFLAAPFTPRASVLRATRVEPPDASERLQWLRGARGSVAYTRDPRRPQLQRVAFLKTHKTGAGVPSVESLPGRGERRWAATPLPRSLVLSGTRHTGRHA
jgi:hypothetical protein